MSFVLGLDCKLYYNSASYASPTWVEMDNVTDVTTNLTKGEADVTTRGNNGWRAIAGTLKEGGLDFEMIWNPSDAAFTAIKDAFFNNTQVEFLVLDGSVETNGSQGLRASMEVLNFTRTEPLEEAAKASVSIKPGYNDNAPEWYVVGA